MSEQTEIGMDDVIGRTAVIPVDKLQPEDLQAGKEVGGFNSIKDLDKAEAVILDAMQDHLDPTRKYKNRGLHINNTPGFLSDVIGQELPNGYNRTTLDNFRLSVDPVDNDVINLVNGTKSETDPDFVQPSDIRVVTVTRDLHYAGTTRTASTQIAYSPQSRIHGSMTEPATYIFRAVKKGEGTDMDNINKNIVEGRANSNRRVKNNQRRRPMSAGLPTLGKRR